MVEENDMKWISGFWRRIGALVLDVILLGAFGLGLGAVFESHFVELGGWGRFVGFFIALIYFGILNSRLSNGQTVGKRILKIKVVRDNNQTIDLPRSLARYSVLGVPFFLNGAHFTTNTLSSFWLYPLSFIVFGGLFSIVYLYIFNRVTRQSLHDLIVGTYVVNADSEKAEVGSVWRPHLVVVGALFLLAAVAPAFMLNLTQSKPFDELLSAQTALMAVPSVNYATISYGKSTFSSAGEGSKTTTYVSAQAFLKQNHVKDEKLARELAHILASSYPEALQRDVIQVNLLYGYDIGIASKWRNHAYNFSPMELAHNE